MSKVKLKDATKELLKSAQDTLVDVSSLRSKASKLAQKAKKWETQFVREAEQEQQKQKKEEIERLVSKHTKAYTMPDTDETIQPESQVAKADETAVKKPVVEKNIEKPIEQPVVEKAVEKSTTKSAEKPVEKNGEKPLEVITPSPVTTVEKAETVKVDKVEKADRVEKMEKVDTMEKVEKVTEKATTKVAEEEKVVEPVAEKVQKSQPVAKQTSPQQPVKPVSAPQPARNEQANVQPKPQTPRPVQGGAPRPAGGYGRPANPQANPQGPYGRPANPQGPYGRPANPQGPYGRPANPQGGAPRPANPQGPYGRPANPQGGAPRPVGGYGRPANPQGPYGRPANPQGGAPRPAGGYGRPANPQGGAPRPAGGGYGRPAGGAPRPTGGGYGRPAGGASQRPATSRKPAVETMVTPEKERVSNYDPNKKNYVRQHDPEKVAKNRKQLARESYGRYDDDVIRGGRKARSKKQPSAQQLMAPIKIDKAYMTADTITVRDLTERIGKQSGEILKKLLMLNVMATINSELDFDTASLVCSDFGIELEMNLAKTAEDELIDTDHDDNEADLVPRPPVVTIMGHVDHGKTSLLDYIRKSQVTAGEAGGITQHIGAYTVTVNNQPITFLDTPGHEAFTAMRARGAKSTDIAILVVAADDGVMPQTVEAINHAKAADVPIIIAINKMDKEGANPDRIKTDLTAHGLVAEEWGGDTIMCPVSAHTGAGVEELLEMILLTADMQQLRANPNRMAKGVIIEAKLDKSRGPVATILLQNGTLHVGDNIVAGLASGRVRAMLNDRGERVQEAGPSIPVEVSGFNDVPSAGDDMMAVADDHLGRQVVQERRDKMKAARNASTAKVSLDNLFSRIDQSKMVTLNIIVKADVQGSVEAVKQALEKLSNEEVRVHILHSGVGAITKDDVNLASAFDAIIIGFNIRPDNNARDSAEREGVDIRLYRIIYQAIEDISKAMKGLLDPEFKEVWLGQAEIRSVFRITGAGMVAGCYVKDGKLQRNAKVRLLRDNVVVYEGNLSSLKRFKDDAKEVATGYECGVSLDGFNDIKENDIIECFIMEEIER